MTQKGKNEFIILGVGLAVLAFLWLPKLKPAEKLKFPLISDAYFQQQAAETGHADTPKAKKAVPTELLNSIKYTGADNRDPLDNSTVVAQQKVVAPPPPKAPLPQLTISAVVWGTPRPQAIINNKLLNIGETIEGVKIVDIGKEGIKINFNGEETVLPTK